MTWGIKSREVIQESKQKNPWMTAVMAIGLCLKGTSEILKNTPFHRRS